MNAPQPLNSGLYRLHRIFCIAFMSFAVIMAVIGVLGLLRHDPDAGIGFVGIGFLPFAILHWYAAEGARYGKRSGRIISRIIGTVWLVGFPIGTALGIYTWAQTGSKWCSD
jgi:Na+/proline symporter